jgi:hypothetical protein
MSKIRKLKNNPKLFFKDVFKKKTEIKKPVLKAVPKPVETLLLNNINFVMPYKFVLHTGEKDGALAHLNIWIPYFEEANIEYVIITRHISAYKQALHKYPYLKVIFAKSKADIDEVFDRIKSIKACFYPSNTGNNIHPLFQNKIKHVFIGHGDSDKTASAHKFFRVYDENWVAGDAHIDRFKNADFDSKGLAHIKVGRPNLYNVISQSEEHWKTRFNDKFQLLYLPTWEGTYKEQNYSSLSIIKENINLISKIENIDVKIKLHPFSGNREKKFLDLHNDLKNEKHCTVIDKNETVDSVIAKSNIFICDISAVVSECLAGNAPIFIYIPKDKDIKISQSNMPYENYCYSFSTPEELTEKLNTLLNGEDNLEEMRKKAMNYILNKKDTINLKFIKELNKIAGK